jgi:hypothetical protein
MTLTESDATMDKNLEEQKEEFLAHHGVKGMKWGVTKADGSRVEVSKKDYKWIKKATRKYPMDAYNRAASKMNDGEIDRINGKREYQNVDMLDPKNKRVADKYYNEYSTAMTKALNDSVKELGLVSPDGALKIGFEYDVETDAMPRWGLIEND